MVAQVACDCHSQHVGTKIASGTVRTHASIHRPLGAPAGAPIDWNRFRFQSFGRWAHPQAHPWTGTGSASNRRPLGAPTDAPIDWKRFRFQSMHAGRITDAPIDWNRFRCQCSAAGRAHRRTHRLKQIPLPIFGRWAPPQTHPYNPVQN